MAITLVKEVYDGRATEIGDDGSRTLTRAFLVQTDTGLTTEFDVLEHPDVPKRGDPYVGPSVLSAGARALSISVKPDRSPLIWRVEVKYGNKTGGSSGSSGQENGNPSEGKGKGDGSPYAQSGVPPGYGGGASGAGPANTEATDVKNPLDRPATARYYAVKEQEVQDRDVNGDAIINAAGAPYDPPVMRAKVRLGMAVTRNQARFQPDALAEYVDTVNAAAWCGGGAKTWRLDDFDATRKFEEGVWFYEVTYKFVYDKDGWNPRKILEQGSFYYPSGENTPARFKDKLGNTLARGLLKADGDRLPFEDDPVFTSWDVYEEADFEQLGLFK